MKKNRKGKRRKRRLIVATTLKIAPIALIIAAIGRWTWTSGKGEIMTLFNINENDRFLANDNQRVEQIVDEEVSQNTVETEDNEIETTPAVVVPTIPSVPFPNIIEEEEFERTSSELYDTGVEIPQPDWDNLNAVNELSDSWIYIAGTKVNNPIVQYRDNDYYLHHDIENNDDNEGTLFIDYRDNPLSSEMSELSDVTTVYGHNQRSGRMFGTITNYKSQAFYDKWPYGIVLTENGNVYKLDFFAGIIVDGSDEANVYIPDFIDESEFNNYFDYVVSNSTFTSDCDIQYGDKIIALSTCSYEYDNARYVLFGRLTKQLTNDQEVEKTLGSN